MTAARSTLKVLIIDDQPSEHAIYEDYLTDDPLHDFQLSHAYNGTEGASLYSQLLPDCVLLDYHLPDQDGLDVLRGMAEKHPILPVVMLTGEGSESVAVIAMQNGAQDYMPKHCLTPTALQRCIERAVERCNLLRRMEHYRQDLERSNEDLERFATVVAHDLKSPLRAITQHLGRIQKTTHDKLDEQSLRSMAFAIDGASRMRELIDALLEYASLGFGEKILMQVDGDEIMKLVCANLSALIEERGAQVHWEKLPVVVTDKIQLLQLLQNLIANALKFCGNAPRIDVYAQCKNDAWIFAVKDNGIGIAPEHRGKIFTIFKRLHSEQTYPGIGLGLAICERVAKNHGGRIWVESQPGEGSVFYFTLPLVDTDAQDIMPATLKVSHG